MQIIELIDRHNELDGRRDGIYVLRPYDVILRQGSKETVFSREISASPRWDKHQHMVDMQRVLLLSQPIHPFNRSYIFSSCHFPYHFQQKKSEFFFTSWETKMKRLFFVSF